MRGNINTYENVSVRPTETLTCERFSQHDDSQLATNLWVLLLILAAPQVVFSMKTCIFPLILQSHRNGWNAAPKIILSTFSAYQQSANTTWMWCHFFITRAFLRCPDIWEWIVKHIMYHLLHLLIYWYDLCWITFRRTDMWWNGNHRSHKQSPWRGMWNCLPI